MAAWGFPPEHATPADPQPQSIKSCSLKEVAGGNLEELERNKSFIRCVVRQLDHVPKQAGKNTTSAKSVMNNYDPYHFSCQTSLLQKVRSFHGTSCTETPARPTMSLVFHSGNSAL